MNKTFSAGLLASIAIGLPGCNGCGSSVSPAPSGSASASASEPVAAAPSSTVPRGPAILVPSGPPMTILAGKGIGPIRFGATVATIERLMQLPCEVRTETLCSYPGRATDLVLTDGVVSEVRLHRRMRPIAGGKTVGMFNGATMEGVALDMLPTAADELLGKPLSVTPVAEGGPAGTVEIRTYKGLRLAIDRLPTGKLVIGEIDVTKE